MKGPILGASEDLLLVVVLNLGLLLMSTIMYTRSSQAIRAATLSAPSPLHHEHSWS